MSQAAVVAFVALSSLASCARTHLAAAEPREAAFRPAQDEAKWTQAELERASEQIMGDLERLRGEKFLRPVAVKVSTKKELLEYVALREAKHEPAEKRAADELIAKLLGAVPHDMDMRARVLALLEAQVAGFYDPDSNSFSLMDTVPQALARITLAHELDHALDDQLFGIDTTLERVGEDTDAVLAFQAVVEGSGTIVMTQWMVDAMKSGRDGLDMSELSQKQLQEMSSMAGAPDWLWKPMMAVYSGGAAFLAKTDALMTAATKPLDSAGLRQAFENPPRSTEQVLHPDKYWHAEQRDEPRRITFDTSSLDRGWTVLREDTLGELAIAIITTPREQRDNTDLTNPMAMLGLKFTNEIASGWDGDRLVLAGKDDARVLHWVSVWDSERDAGEFYGAMRHTLPALEAAAKALSKGKDSGATLEYGDAGEIVLTVRLATSKSDGRGVVRDLVHSLASDPR